MLKNIPTIQFLLSFCLIQITPSPYSGTSNKRKIYQYVLQVIPQSLHPWITRVTVSTAGKTDNCTAHQSDMLLKGFDELSFHCEIFHNLGL